jgi:hypothetical protein
MSSSTRDSGNSDDARRWAALDSRFERLVSAADRQLADAKDQDHDCVLRAAS